MTGAFHGGLPARDARHCLAVPTGRADPSDLLGQWCAGGTGRRSARTAPPDLRATGAEWIATNDSTRGHDVVSHLPRAEPLCYTTQHGPGRAGCVGPPARPDRGGPP